MDHGGVEGIEMGHGPSGERDCLIDRKPLKSGQQIFRADAPTLDVAPEDVVVEVRSPAE